MIKITTRARYKRALKQANSEGHYEGYYDALMLVKRVLEAPEGKIITQPLTLVGDGQTIAHNVFIGCEPYGIKVEPEEQ